MNIYSLLPLFALVSTLLLAFYILLLDWKSKENQLFSVFLSLLAFWSLSNFLLLNTDFVAEAKVYDFFATVGSAFTGVLLLHFVGVFIKIRHVAFRIFVGLSYGLAFCLCLVAYFTPLFKSDIIVEYWGFTYLPGPLYLVFASFVMGLSLFGFFLAFHYYKSMKDPARKRQIALLLVALCIPIIGGTISQVIFPAINIKIFPVTSTLSAVMAILIAASISKYRMFKQRSFSIRKKILFGFFIITFLSGIIGHSSVSLSEDILFEHIGSRSVEFADDSMGLIDLEINNQIVHWLFVSHSSRLLTQTVSSSNAEFEALDNISSFVLEIDEQWRLQNESSPCALCEQTLNNSLSDLFRSYADFYNTQFNVSIIAEVFATNRFGAVVGQSSIVSDFDQSDELWWQQAVSDDLFVADLHSDQSANSSKVLAICVSINDKGSGDSIGVLKVVLNLEALFEMINEFNEEIEYDSSLWLLNSEGSVLYSTDEYVDFEPFSEELFSVFSDEGDLQCEYVLVDDMLYAHAVSTGSGVFESLGWRMVILSDTEELFAPVDSLVLLVGILTACVFVCSLVLGITFSGSVTKPLICLNKEALRMSKGDLSHPVKVSSDDEVGELAASFESMRQALQKLQEDLEGQVKKRTAELEQKVDELQRFKSVTVNRELRMLELKDELADLKKSNKDDDDNEEL